MAHSKPVAHEMVGGGHIAGLSREARQPKKRKKLRTTVERSANGGHIVTHHAEDYGQDTTHTFGAGEHDKMFDHLRSRLGINRTEAAAKARAATDPEADGAAADDDGDGD